ncbi:hypothetical protein H0W26_00415 [Candidatus Dependentiae bacterium]|nr:hypothetical protein [Candidatus Dependentiae bacterium]
MTLTRYCSFILLISAPLCHANPTPARNKLALSGIADATLALLSTYATFHIAKTAQIHNETVEPLKDMWSTLANREKNYLQKAFCGEREDKNAWGPQVVRPLAYLTLLYTTGRLAVTRSVSAYKLLKEAYTMETNEALSSVVAPQPVQK